MELSKPKKLLIGVPHYNSSKFVSRLLNTIANLKFSNAIPKVVIVDDGSSACEVARLMHTTSKFNVDVILNNQNNGISSARNSIIEHAISGNYDYIMFADADDYYITKYEIEIDSRYDVSFYGSAEVMDSFINEPSCDNLLLKDNITHFDNLDVAVKEYLNAPNKVQYFTTCWAKIFSTEFLKSNRIRFLEDMHTFEDVHFMLSCIRSSPSVVSKNYKIYCHTNRSEYLKSATMAYQNDVECLFDFIKLYGPLSGGYYVALHKSVKSAKIALWHFMACYYSIALIRSAVRIYQTTKSIKDVYLFVKNKLQSEDLKISFMNYDVSKAGGRYLTKYLVLLNQPLALTIYLIFVGRRRYG